MGNISTITYDGEVLAETEEEGAVAVIYDRETIANLNDGDTKTFYCANTIPKTNIQIGSKTIFCAVKKMIADIIVAVKSSFVAEPSAYTLIGKYTSSQTWTAPEDGWFQIEVFGASGNSGTSWAWYSYSDYGELVRASTGGGGGGGGYACSRIKMNKGDSIEIVCGAVGSSSSAEFQSSLETYNSIIVTSGKNGANSGTDVNNPTGGTGGAGGVASGGNYLNYDGGKGSNGTGSTSGFPNGASGGKAGYTGGNAGASSPNTKRPYDTANKTYSANKGFAGFINIYRGDTNVVA